MMRIDFGVSNVVPAVDTTTKVNTGQAAPTSSQAGSHSATEDKTTLSSGSSSVDSLTQTALQPIPSRAARVAALQLAVRTAQYQLDSAQIAQALSSADL